MRRPMRRPPPPRTFPLRPCASVSASSRLPGPLLAPTPHRSRVSGGPAKDIDKSSQSTNRTITYEWNTADSWDADCSTPFPRRHPPPHPPHPPPPPAAATPRALARVLSVSHPIASRPHSQVSRSPSGKRQSGIRTRIGRTRARRTKRRTATRQGATRLSTSLHMANRHPS